MKHDLLDIAKEKYENKWFTCEDTKLNIKYFVYITKVTYKDNNEFSFDCKSYMFNHGDNDTSISFKVIKDDKISMFNGCEEYLVPSSLDEIRLEIENVHNNFMNTKAL